MLHITLEIERQIEREAETGLLDQLLDTVRAGGRATCGIAPTLQALYIGSVHTLVVSDGLHLEGSECPACGQLWPGILPTCPGCDTPMRSVHDLFHRAIGQAHAQAARVEVVHDEAARRLQEHCGGLGARLRFR
jgi:peptide subunit release factor 1 (eRF1)